MKDFYIQKKYHDGLVTSKSTERGILYTLHNDLIGNYQKPVWYIDCKPYDVMIKLRVKPV